MHLTAKLDGDLHSFSLPLNLSYTVIHQSTPCYVGDNDLTCDKDWKHVFKCWRNLLLRQWGVVVNGLRIMPDIIQDQFKSAGLSADHIQSLFNPEDQQDVKMAFDMLKDIWNLPCDSPNSR